MLDIHDSLRWNRKACRSRFEGTLRGLSQDTRSGERPANGAATGKRSEANAKERFGRTDRTVRQNCRADTVARECVVREQATNRLDLRSTSTEFAIAVIFGVAFITYRLVESYVRAVCRCATCVMGMMGMFKWLRKDITQRDRNGWNLVQKQCALNNESYRNALQAFIDRRRFSDDTAIDADTTSSPGKKQSDLFVKNNNNKKCENERKQEDSKSIIPGIPHIRASEIFEIGWVAGTEDRYLELIFAEWQNTRVSLKRHTHPECKRAVKADLDVLSEIRHPNVLLLMATTHTDDHGLVSIFESIDCTLYNYIHEQGERISIQGIAKCGGRLSDALRHSHMRGYIHGAISSHCVYLASSGIVKLGGWELAVHTSNLKPQREYEERLRTEIFRWQAPEIFQGYEPRKESDVYGLTLLIWEMCTMHVPWSGYNRADVQRQYVNWKRGVIMDLYNFPPLLNNLLEAGLQLDITKRTLDMNRMRRFLQRLEMQYEDEEPVYVDQYANNNNETAKTYVLPIAKSPIGTPKNKATKLTKSASVKKLSQCSRNTESPAKQHLYANKVTPKKNENSKATMPQVCQHLNFYSDDDNMIWNAQNIHKTFNYASCKSHDSDTVQNDETNVGTAQPWNSTYRKVKVPRDTTSSRSMTASVYTSSSLHPESTDDESFKDARSNLKQLKEVLANKREHFFYGSDTSQNSTDPNSNKEKHHATLESIVIHRKLNIISQDDMADILVPKEFGECSIILGPNATNKLFLQARNKDYEPHKPASHKTSLEPKCSKSPGEYNPSYTKPLFQQCNKVPYSRVPNEVKDAVMHPQILNSDSQSFFESSLWRKEKLICLSKMRKSYQDELSYLFTQPQYVGDAAETLSTKKQCTDSNSPKSESTYIISDISKVADTESSQEAFARISGNESDSSEVTSLHNKTMKVLKDALDRATDIVRSVTPNTEESGFSPPFKSYHNIEVTADDPQRGKSIFEDLYDLKNVDEEIRTIERSSNGNATSFLNRNNTNLSNNPRTKLDYNTTSNTSCENDDNPSDTCDTTYSRNFVCESIAEVSSEFNTSCIDTRAETNAESFTDKPNIVEEKKESSESVTDAISRARQSNNGARVDIDSTDKRSIMSNLTLMLLNDSSKLKNCRSCHQSALPRRRSLPAALSQLKTINNSALGKLPIRKGDVPDNTVEDLYIDDDFGGSLNVNMVLLDEDISLDEDFLPDISEL